MLRTGKLPAMLPAARTTWINRRPDTGFPNFVRVFVLGSFLTPSQLQPPGRRCFSNLHLDTFLNSVT